MKKEMDSIKISLSKAALIAGISLSIMTILSLIIFPSLQPTLYSISGILIIIILDIIVALSLHILLKPVNKKIALIMSSFRIIYAVIFAIALYNIPDINKFYSIWDIGLVFFGFHLFFLGYLVFNSEYIPKILGILLVIASFGYVIDSFGKFLLPDYKLTVSMFTFIGEVLFGIWLLFKGRNISNNESIS